MADNPERAQHIIRELSASPNPGVRAKAIWAVQLLDGRNRPRNTYRIVHNDDGWHLYRNDQVIDVDRDEEQAALADVFRWASAVVRYEDRVEVDRWTATGADDRVEYTAEIEPAPR